EFLHFCHYPCFGWQHVLPIRDIDRAARKLIYYLTQDFRTLPHLLDPDEIAVVAITDRSENDIKIVLIIVEIRMFTSQIVLDAAPAKVRTGKGVSDRSI